MSQYTEFLPMTRADMAARGWEQCDFVYVIGDAYVDHPSFGHAIISRVLESHGYKVGIISQPDWHKPSSIATLGAPRLGFLVMGGNMDSMVCHYSVAKKRRTTDAYTPGGVMGKRPDYATYEYCKLIRKQFPDSCCKFSSSHTAFCIRFQNRIAFSFKIGRPLLCCFRVCLIHTVQNYQPGLACG